MIPEDEPKASCQALMYKHSEDPANRAVIRQGYSAVRGHANGTMPTLELEMAIIPGAWAA